MKGRVFPLVAWALVFFATAALVGLVVQGQWMPQPAPMNHKKHLEFGIACASCHVGAKDGDKATIPNVRVCAFCHIPGQERPNTPGILGDYIREMEPIPWVELNKLPAHVRFSHVRHTVAGGIDCAVCHGDMKDREPALIRPLVGLDMAACVGCHRRERVTTDCLDCHR